MVKRSNRVYNKIKELLTQFPELRDSDKRLAWAVWEFEGYVFCGSINYERFMNHGCTSYETIRRTRQKIQETTPELRGSSKIRKFREEKQKEKGTWIYRENVAIWQPQVGNAESDRKPALSNDVLS